MLTGDACSNHQHRDKEWTAQHISLEFRGDGHACQECVPQVPRAFDSLWLDERPKGAGVDGEGNIGEPQCKKNGAEAQNSQRKLGRGTCEVKRQSKQSEVICTTDSLFWTAETNITLCYVN